MKLVIFACSILFHFSCIHAQNDIINHTKIEEDLDQIISDISRNYIYLKDKNVDLSCVRENYKEQISTITTEEQTVLFFEYLLDEFYDSHLILNTNRKSSFRLYAPIYATLHNGMAIIENVWQTQISTSNQNVLGAEIIKINGINIDQAIEQFPTQCNDKDSPKVREWILNKILAGRYNEPRILSLKLDDNRQIVFDLDKIDIKSTTDLLSSTVDNNIAVIRIHNSLGNNNLVKEFDKTLDKLMNTEGLIIDLRNTVDGGNTYVARGIMSRFINEAKPYQKHWIKEKFDGDTEVVRSWVEYVSPRKEQYNKPVVILVGRWTGSMGEGLAIGFEGMDRAKIVGTKMERLAGEMNGFGFTHQNYGYRLSTAKLFHVNGIAREEYIPPIFVSQSTLEKDEILEKGIEILNLSIED